MADSERKANIPITETGNSTDCSGILLLISSILSVAWGVSKLPEKVQQEATDTKQHVETVVQESEQQIKDAFDKKITDLASNGAFAERIRKDLSASEVPLTKRNTRKRKTTEELLNDTPTERMIARALDQQTSLEFPDNTLKEVVDFIQQLHEVPIRLDEQALTDVGLDAETRINLVISGITLRSAMNLMLENVNGEELAFIVEDEVIKITTAEKIRERYGE